MAEDELEDQQLNEGEEQNPFENKTVDDKNYSMNFIINPYTGEYEFITKELKDKLSEEIVNKDDLLDILIKNKDLFIEKNTRQSISSKAQ